MPRTTTGRIWLFFCAQPEVASLREVKALAFVRKDHVRYSADYGLHGNQGSGTDLGIVMGGDDSKGRVGRAGRGRQSPSPDTWKSTTTQSAAGIPSASSCRFPFFTLRHGSRSVYRHPCNAKGDNV